MVKNMGSRVRYLNSRPYTVTLLLLVVYFPPHTCLSFLICKMGILTPSLKGSWVDQMSYGGGKASYTQPRSIAVVITRSTAADRDGARPMGQLVLC